MRQSQNPSRDAGTAQTLRLTVPADLAAVGPASERCRDWLERASVPPDGILIGLVEALNNIIRHACPDLAAGARIGLTLRLGPGHVIARLVDPGRPMPDDPQSYQTFPDPAALPEGGFGWPLIQSLTSQVRYRRRDGHNILLLIFARNAPDIAP